MITIARLPGRAATADEDGYRPDRPLRTAAHARPVTAAGILGASMAMLLATAARLVLGRDEA